MIIVLKPHPTPEQIQHVLDRIEDLGLVPHVSQGVSRTIIGVIGDEGKLQVEPLQAIEGVEQVVPILKPFKLASREFHDDRCSECSVHFLELRRRRIRLHGLVDVHETRFSLFQEVVSTLQPILILGLARLHDRNALIDIGLQLLEFFLLQKITPVTGGICDIGAVLADFILGGRRSRSLDRFLGTRGRKHCHEAERGKDRTG